LKDESNLFFSVVVPTYERPDDLRICLNSLSIDKQSGCPCYEIIVTDDSKCDESRRMVAKEFPNVSWDKGKQNGPAGNRNAGVARAKGEWIVFLDDDCIAGEGYLNAYAKAIESNPNVLVFEGRIFADRPRKTWAEESPENEDGGMLWTSNLCIRRKLFVQLGGLDERFEVAYEDVEFALRLRQLGYNHHFSYNASVCHPWRPVSANKSNWKKSGYQFQELVTFLNKHPDQYPFHSAKIFIKNATRGLFKDLIWGIFKFKGRGNIFKLSKIISSLKAAYIVFHWKNSNRQKFTIK
jgi:GT2 family glycosyltransferase